MSNEKNGAAVGSVSVGYVWAWNSGKNIIRYFVSVAGMKLESTLEVFQATVFSTQEAANEAHYQFNGLLCVVCELIRVERKNGILSEWPVSAVLPVAPSRPPAQLEKLNGCVAFRERDSEMDRLDGLCAVMGIARKDNAARLCFRIGLAALEGAQREGLLK